MPGLKRQIGRDQPGAAGLGHLLCRWPLQPVLLLRPRLGGEEGAAAPDAGTEAAGLPVEEVEYCVTNAPWGACCTGDEGRSFGAAVQAEAPNYPELLQSKAVVVSVRGKGVTVITSGGGWGDERKRTTVDASKTFRRHQNQTRTPGLGAAWRIPAYWPCGVRCSGGVTPIWAPVGNVRTLPAMPREKAQAVDPRGRKYRYAGEGRTAP
jgi:hypothetical protein